VRWGHCVRRGFQSSTATGLGSGRNVAQCTTAFDAAFGELLGAGCEFDHSVNVVVVDTGAYELAAKQPVLYLPPPPEHPPPSDIGSPPDSPTDPLYPGRRLLHSDCEPSSPAQRRAHLANRLANRRLCSIQTTLYTPKCSTATVYCKCKQQQQQQQQELFNGLCSGTTQVGRYQKKHFAFCLNIGLCCVQAGFPHLLSSGFLWSRGR